MSKFNMFVRNDAYLFTDGKCCEWVVARHHEYLDTSSLTFGDSFQDTVF